MADLADGRSAARSTAKKSTTRPRRQSAGRQAASWQQQRRCRRRLISSRATGAYQQYCLCFEFKSYNEPSVFVGVLVNTKMSKTRTVPEMARQNSQQYKQLFNRGMVEKEAKREAACSFVVR